MPTAKKPVKSKQDVAAEAFFRAPTATTPASADWLETDYSGQLAVDVYQTPEAVVITSTIAGITADDLDVAVRGDTVTIRGIRRSPATAADDQYLYRECYWGGFSRSVVLPVDIRADGVQATLKSGVLTITLPKSESAKVRTVSVQELDDA